MLNSVQSSPSYSAPSDSASTVKKAQEEARDFSLKLIQKTLGIEPSEVKKSEQAKANSTASPADNFDVDALVETIWTFVAGRIQGAISSGASDSEVEGLWQQAERGVEQGFSEAIEIINALGMMDDKLQAKIDEAYTKLTDLMSQRDASAKYSASEKNLSEDVVTLSSDYTYDQKIDLVSAATDLDPPKANPNQAEEYFLQVRTKEGDIVEVHALRNKDDNNGTDYEIRATGNLNQEEVDDINALLKEVDELYQTYDASNLDIAMKKAAELNIDGSSLKAMDFAIHKGAGHGAIDAYKENNEARSLPSGLAPLQDYAHTLVESQEKWQQTFDNPDVLLDTIKQHPAKEGFYETSAQLLQA